MIEVGRRKGIYDRLERADLTSFLAGHPGGADLISAADVFNYCGTLPPIFAAAAKALRDGGLLAFSLEAHDGPEPMVLRPSLRFAHQREAARAALVAAGFDIVCFDEGVLRFDRAEPVAGYFVLARYGSSRTAVEGAHLGDPNATVQALH